MIDHVSIEVSDLARATRFYEKVLGALGMSKLRAGAHTSGFGKTYPELWINERTDMTPTRDRSGAHLCLRARTTEIVDAFHTTALAEGATSDGAPGFRKEYGDRYYAAFVRDPDGNRVEVVTFVAGDA